MENQEIFTEDLTSVTVTFSLEDVGRLTAAQLGFLVAINALKSTMDEADALSILISYYGEAQTMSCISVLNAQGYETIKEDE
jgi:uncharacterized membrane protein YqgA involved in biofilm formation